MTVKQGKPWFGPNRFGIGRGWETATPSSGRGAAALIAFLLLIGISVAVPGVPPIVRLVLMIADFAWYVALVKAKFDYGAPAQR